MSRIKDIISKHKSCLLNIYFTAGFPNLESTLEVMKSLKESGADMVEIGMPYSDPLADGPVIQMSNAKAISNGMTISKLFDQLKEFRKDSALSGIGVILMGYLNPVLQYGFEKFCKEAATVGIDGLIIPDLPEYEYEEIYGPIIKRYGLDFIFLVTPETEEKRIRKLDSLSSGFLYAVASSSTTGKDQDMKKLTVYLSRLKNMKLKNPVLVGFGIRNRKGFESVCKQASGAIVGSAYIRALEGGSGVGAATKSFLSSLLG